MDKNRIINMNKTIHQQIFGQCPHELRVYKKDNKDPYDDYKNFTCHKCKKGFRGLAFSEGMIICPNYAHNFSDAMKVWEWIKAQYPVKQDIFFDGDNRVCVRGTNDEINVLAQAETLPLALSLAAVKLVKQNQKNHKDSFVRSE